MNILTKTRNGIQCVPLESSLLARRKIYMTNPGGIDLANANEIIRQLLYLEAEDPEAPIDFYISSPGGQVTAGLLIYDQIKGMQTPVNMYCCGMAASMAAIILAGGRKGSRFILPHSKVMIHEPLIDGGVGGSATSLQRTAEAIMETKRTMVNLLTADTGRTIAEIERAIAYDNYMNAKEAVDFGICDLIVERV